MREILFRGKRNDNGEWIEGFLHIKCFQEVPRDRYVIEYETEPTKEWKPKYMVAEVIPKTVGQYTGLTDKNGKKIFEGDIVKCRHNWRLQVYPNGQIPDVEKYFFEQKIRNAYGKYKVENPNWMGDDYYYFRNYVIEYYAPNGCFRVRNGGQFHNLTGSYIFNRYLEVIGNIHDNPELLKGE
jgi:uncharacterized phage protein (TIGR01671 family)